MMEECKHENIDKGVNIYKSGDYVVTEVYCRMCGTTLSETKELIKKENDESS